MHKKGLVACIKVGGRILREQSERVYLPFGSEYSVYLKNLEHRRVCAKIFIDGANVSDGGFIINGSSSMDIERFVRNGNLQSGNCFKFIERTEAIEKHRGVEAEDGLVRIEYQFEKEPPKIEYQKTVHIHDHVYRYPYWPYYPYEHQYITWACNSSFSNAQGDSTIGCGATGMRSGTGASAVQNTQRSVQNTQSSEGPGAVMAMACSMTPSDIPNEAGITVPGSESNQQFQHVYGFDPESETNVMVLHLIGEVGSKPVSEPITVEKKSTCTYCGKTNKTPSKYCSQCGASLVIL